MQEDELVRSDLAAAVEKRGPSQVDEAIEEAFRGVHRIEAMAESFRDLLAPVMRPQSPLDTLRPVMTDRPEPAPLVRQIEEIAGRLSEAERIFAETRERLAV